MIYLQNTEGEHLLYIPKPMVVPVGPHVLFIFQATSTIDQEMLISQANYPQVTTDLYIIVPVVVYPGLPNGEYNYDLKLGDRVISSGILVVGENSDPSQYEKEITYEQYETER